jgi:hypothetical protein
MTKVPAIVRANIERYFALYGLPNNPGLMAEALTGYGRDPKYPRSVQKAAMSYIIERIAEERVRQEPQS